MGSFLESLKKYQDKIGSPTVEADYQTYDESTPRNKLASILPEFMHGYVKQSVGEEKDWAKGFPEMVGTSTAASIKNVPEFRKGVKIDFPDPLEMLFRKAAKKGNDLEKGIVVDTVHSVGDRSQLSDDMWDALQASRRAESERYTARLPDAKPSEFRDMGEAVQTMKDKIQLLREALESRPAQQLKKTGE